MTPFERSLFKLSEEKKLLVWICRIQVMTAKKSHYNISEWVRCSVVSVVPLLCVYCFLYMQGSYSGGARSKICSYAR